MAWGVVWAGGWPAVRARRGGGGAAMTVLAAGPAAHLFCLRETHAGPVPAAVPRMRRLRQGSRRRALLLRSVSGRALARALDELRLTIHHFIDVVLNVLVLLKDLEFLMLG